MFVQTEAIKSPEDFKKHFHSDKWLTVAEDVCRRHAIAFDALSRADNCEHIVFFVDEKYVVKIFTPFRCGFAREKQALEFARGKTSLTLPEIVHAGEIGGFEYLVITQLRGAEISRYEWLRLEDRYRVPVVHQLAQGLRELHSHSVDGFDFDWQKFIDHQVETCIDRQIAAGVKGEWLDALPRYLEENLPLLPRDAKSVFLHGDVHFGNLRFRKENDTWVIAGLFDLADSLTGFHEYDFLAPGVLMIQGQGELQREFFRAYGYTDSEINEELRRRLMLLTCLYECSDLRRYATRLSPDAIDLSFDELERAIWSFDTNL